MKIRIAGMVNDSIVDGPGFRLAVFTQGCPHECMGCHNPGTHSMGGGRVIDTESAVEAMRENSLLDGLTLSGGEPFVQPEPCAELARQAKALGLNVWVYSGYTFEQLYEAAQMDERVQALLNACDVLVDGRFVLGQRTLGMRFRGSKNQRLIDLPRSMEAGRAAVLAE